MARPDTEFEWATDASYPAGAHSWNETATKIAPVAGKIAEGYDPRERPPAQQLNWLLNLIGLWISWLSSATMRWRGFGVAPLETNISHDEGGGVWSGAIRATADAALYDGGVIDCVPVGVTISDFQARITGTGVAQNVVVRLNLYNPMTVGHTVLATITAVDPPAAAANYTAAVFAPYEMAAGDMLIVDVSMPKNTTVCHSFGIATDAL